jgi:hypothetical protein
MHPLSSRPLQKNNNNNEEIMHPLSSGPLQKNNYNNEKIMHPLSSGPLQKNNPAISRVMRHFKTHTHKNCSVHALLYKYNVFPRTDMSDLHKLVHCLAKDNKRLEKKVEYLERQLASPLIHVTEATERICSSSSSVAADTTDEHNKKTCKCNRMTLPQWKDTLTSLATKETYTIDKTNCVTCDKVRKAIQQVNVETGDASLKTITAFYLCFMETFTANMNMHTVAAGGNGLPLPVPLSLTKIGNIKQTISNIWKNETSISRKMGGSKKCVSNN